MTSATNEASAAPRPVFDWLMAVAVLAVAGAYARIVYFTPPDATLGLAQKIYYVHVPAAIAGYMAVSLTALMSLVYLWLHDERADRLADASAEVGLLFLTVVLTSGPIWAHSSWGTWWSWGDMRLTLTLFLWFIVAGYLVMRGAIEDHGMRARYAAVLGILGALLIPFIHLSVYLFRTLHPMPIVLKPSEPSLPSDMLKTFLIATLAFALFCVALIRARYRYGLARDLLARLESGGAA
jgi:heme exporter protein C